MLKAFLNMWRVAELRNKLIFTISMLAIYRIGFRIPLMGIDRDALREMAERMSGTAGGNLMDYMTLFTGGSLSQSTIFGLGIMPYISAAIIFQLLATVLESLKQLQKEGPAGRQKIQEYTRYATVGLCVIQAVFWLKFISSQRLVYAEFLHGPNALIFWACGILGLTGGTVFLMWLGEQIDKYGIGNGVSLILTAGIISRMPDAILYLANRWDPANAADESAIGLGEVLFLAAAFVGVVAGAVLLTVAQRRIPIQQAKHTRGRRVFGGQKHYLPLRVNHAGVMPIIFASSLMVIPSVAFGMLAGQASGSGAPGWWQWLTGLLASSFEMGSFPYILCQIILIYVFSYLWTTIQFSPEDMAKQLKDHGSFIPGLRPGPRTAEYLESVMERITYVGAGFLAIIAIIPELVSTRMNIPFNVASFLGGTGLLIVVAVGLDLVQRIEANLLMRNYQGFLGTGGKVRGRRG